MIYTTGSIVRAIVADSGEIVTGVVTRVMGEGVVVACRLQVSGGRIVYSREVVGEVVEVLDGPDDPVPSGATLVLPPPPPNFRLDVAPVNGSNGAIIGTMTYAEPEGALEGEDA